MFITCSGPNGDLVERDPTFRVLLIVVLPKLFELKVPWPYDLSEMRSELFEAWGAVFGIVLDAAHVLVGLTVISMTSDMAADVTRRKTSTKIMRRVLVDLLILIATSIAVIVTTTSTTILSTLVAAATTATATTTWRIEWRQIVTMLATWMF
jgi:phage-related holin